MVVESIVAVEGLAVGIGVVGEVDTEVADIAAVAGTVAARIGPAVQYPAVLADNTHLPRLHVEVDCTPWFPIFPNALLREIVLRITAAINTLTKK